MGTVVEFMEMPFSSFRLLAGRWQPSGGPHFDPRVTQQTHVNLIGNLRVREARFRIQANCDSLLLTASFVYSNSTLQDWCVTAICRVGRTSYPQATACHALRQAWGCGYEVKEYGNEAAATGLSQCAVNVPSNMLALQKKPKEFLRREERNKSTLHSLATLSRCDRHLETASACIEPALPSPIYSGQPRTSTEDWAAGMKGVSKDRSLFLSELDRQASIWQVVMVQV